MQKDEDASLSIVFLKVKGVESTRMIIVVERKKVSRGNKSKNIAAEITTSAG